MSGISIRESTYQPSGLKALSVYRKRERAYSLPGSAHETKSTFWIVYIPGQPADVVYNKKGAIKRLQDYYDRLNKDESAAA